MPVRPIRRMLVVLAIIAVSGCSTMASPATLAPSSSASSAAAVTPRPSATAPAELPADVAEFRAALETAMAELMSAIGNPDTGAPSEASSAFDDALADGDASTITAAADAVLAHLATARAAIAKVVARQPDSEKYHEWDLMLAGLVETVTAMRDAGVTGSPREVEAARTRMGEVLQDHFWPAMRGSSPDTFRVSFPDGRTATASRARLSTGVDRAFDGSEDSAWTAGDAAPPQWIEVDLGWEATIAGVRLLTFQDIPGDSDHRVTVRSAAGLEQEIARFSGATTDRQWLEYSAPAPEPVAQVVRVTTLSTPGMVGWRTFEVITAPGSTPSACPPANDDLMAGARVMGEPSLSGHEPALAIDGQLSTAWDPGGIRGPGNVRGWLRVILSHSAVVSQVRVQLGQPAGGTVEFTATGWSPSGQAVALGRISGPTKDGEWLSFAGPTPCRALSSVDIGVVSESPAATIREIQVLGTVEP